MANGRLRCRAPAMLWAALAVAVLRPDFAWAEQKPAAVATRSNASASTSLREDIARTRFIIGLEKVVPFQVLSLTHPNRIFVDLPNVKLQLPSLPADAPIGFVKSFRVGLSAPGRARVVIDVTAPIVIEKAVIEQDGKEPKLVLEIVAAGYEASDSTSRHSPPLVGASALGAADLQPPLPKPAISPHARALSMYKPVIVLDPGHGGDDSGATKYGTVEKDVVLAFALKLREQLRATGRYRVLMTRDSDVFVELNERREFAERNSASLFVAIHADYANSSARGATIYSLRESVANALQRSAKGEVGTHVLSSKELTAVKSADGDVGAVKEILADLARREVDMTRERTNVFARSVIEFMGETTNLKENPDRSAAFVVLKTAKVPSILIELGYVTNQADSDQLKSEKWREKVSGSILTAIDNYFSHQLARVPM